MTLVVTHANGFLGCFTREADGTMRQRALIDTGEGAPTAVDLAGIGDRLAFDYGWLAVAPAPANGKRGKTLPAADSEAPAKRKAPKAIAAKRNYDQSDPPKSERSVMIVNYVQTNPGCTSKEIIAGLGMEPNPPRVARWHHTFLALLEAQLIAKRLRPGTKHREQEYFIP